MFHVLEKNRYGYHAIAADMEYVIRREFDPWHTEEGPAKCWYEIDANLYGSWTWTRIATAQSLDEAATFCEQDAGSSVWRPGYEGRDECRWCWTEREYLEQVPAWWFGCNLCESWMDKNVRNEEVTA